MLVFAIFAGTFVVLLITIVIYLYPSASNPSTIPGLDPVSKIDGNLGDIALAGSLHEFLLDLHKKFGPIASFWWGPRYVVSIASAKLFQQHHNVFDRPPELIKDFLPLIGPNCIEFANGEDGRARRNLYDKCLTHGAIQKYFVIIQEVWAELEHRLTEPPSEAGDKVIADGKKKLAAVVKRTVKHRKKDPPQHGEELLLDLILDYTDDEEIQTCDALVYVIGGFHTTGNLLSWGFYFLATHQESQDKVVAEIKEVLGEENVDHTNIGDMKYLRQVIDETLRCAIIAPVAARFQAFDSHIGGHRVPKNTPVIHALGVAAKDETVFPEPDKFDPNRFSYKHTRKRPHLAFSPFGFAGKRVCPGQRFAYAEAAVCMVTLLRKFKVKMVEGQVITPVLGWITHPSEEIWITLSKR